ncbi:IclR family transcriptional regulator [Cryobacterium levicorallinum]|uniref:IclR family transcriptional regulator n=1 Tax=Cryobacterium levicorallinum TaxID=995038 RepID=A0A1I3E6E2_9MICO|nr:IclR family transcriptional regulator [Cryobacterium levicorallinum]TFB82438.1 IclR family transcriptional regulator [Cryobacterium levicorallinum]GEP28587.1 IclR family transcriptional regulator [Cryobacterium levicorallinum]SFH94525.1 transcriptional regulator, IclR family [Cryobacterium levicorallinum]
MKIIPVVTLGASVGGTETADRVADILLLFSQAEGALGGSEISRSLGLSKTVVHRILQSLNSRGLLQSAPDSPGYVLGSVVIGMGNKAWNQLDIRAVAGPILRRLRDTTNETTTLSVVSSHERVYLDQYESTQEFKMVVELGVRYPLHSGASSRAILAHLSDVYVHEAMKQLAALHSDFSEADYLATLASVRRNGYAMSLNERETGAAAVAAPFFDKAGIVLGCISVCGPAFRFQTETAELQAHHVAEAARTITSLLAR